MRKLLYTAVLVAATSFTVLAQQTWLELEATKQLGEKFEIFLAPELRYTENFKLDEYFIEPGVEYKFNDYFAMVGSYRIGNNLNKKGEDRWFGRFAVDAKTGYEWRNLEAKLRFRYTNSDDFTGDEKTNYFRTKLELEYSIKRPGLQPYFAYEFYRDLDVGEFSKDRWETGIQYKINRHHRVSAYFRLNDYLHSDKETIKIVGLCYKLKL
ncbi:MAG: DUF2490 domain-containing protein [Draconibacterium sp.]